MVIPLGDDDSALRRRFHPVTSLLLVANVVVFLVQLGQGNIEQFFMKWAVIPLEYSEGRDLPPHIPVPFWSTIVTSMFMHGSIMHLLGNMLYLWIFGDNVEDSLGGFKYLLFYVLCGIAAALAQIMIDADSRIPSLGASGAISGILGAYLVLHPHQRVRVLVVRMIATMPAIAVIGFWILLQFINGWGQIARVETEETGGVAYAAHIGGFIAGLVLVWVFRPYGVRARA